MRTLPPAIGGKVTRNRAQTNITAGSQQDTPVEEIRIGGGGTRIVTYVDPPDEIKLNLRRSFEDKPPVEVVTVLHHSRR